MRRPTLALSALLLVGCVTPPQTADEVRQGVLGGAAMTKLERRTLARPFNRVWPDVSARATRCLNVTLTGSTPTAYGPMVESVPYNARARKRSASSGEILLQQGKRATGEMPDGGYFVMVVDVEAAGAGSELTVYGPSFGYGSVYAALMAWGEGEAADCPRFPMGAVGQQMTWREQ